MSATRAKKVKMATKSCPECDQQVPVACKSCPCGYIFISRKLLNAKHSEKSPPSTENKHEAKRRRTERVRREKINSTVNKDLENRKRSRSNSHSDHIRRGRGRPKSASAKKHEEERAIEWLTRRREWRPMPVIPELWEAETSGSLEVRNSTDQPGQHGRWSWECLGDLWLSGHILKRRSM
ncbi:UPF0547 protein C16orf87 homolog isoform X3 [Pongo abelii]|uniref:UPF0547 protein C16orf87 homolog isoform X3 n=1 Tax=Pongo abelii TaxID=9601 RepID=UPI0023E7DF17|nr:UPF0547 protein C16orf87 homolog isoform X3 [Pongo abelii]